MRISRRKTDHEPLRVLVHHADAGPARQPAPVDEWRGLTALGHDQSRELAVRLGAMSIRRVLSSPSLRCRQTVVPVARRLGLEVEPCRLLASDVDPARMARFLRDDETRDALLCTHHDLLLGVLVQIAGTGSPLADGSARIDTIGAWVLHGGSDGLGRVHFLEAVHGPEVLTSFG